MMYIIALLVSFALSAGLTPLIRFFAFRLSVVDQPGPRKVHAKPTPLLGGLAVYLAFLITVAIFWSRGLIIDGKISPTSIIALLTGGFVLMLGGYLDDKYNLKPRLQIIFPLVAIAVAIYGGITIRFVTNPLGGILDVPVIAGTIVAFIWLLGMVYTTKFLDGLDGLTTGISAIGAIIIYVVSLYWDVHDSGTSYLALILAGSCLGFLLYNWHPAKIFLGEGGSVFCGFALGALSIISGSKIATTLLVMGIPVLDVVWVIIRRVWQGKSPTMADRKHLHFRLFDAGLSHRQVVLLLYFLTASFGISSLYLSSSGKILALVTLSIVMIAIAGMLVLLYRTKGQ